MRNNPAGGEPASGKPLALDQPVQFDGSVILRRYEWAVHRASDNGEIEPGEEALAAALREFREEVGLKPPAGELLELGSVRNKSGKTMHAWAVAGDLDLSGFHSNTVSIEWPPRSGKQREFPEIDRALYYGIEAATVKMHEAELPLLQRLLEKLTAKP